MIRPPVHPHLDVRILQSSICNLQFPHPLTPSPAHPSMNHQSPPPTPDSRPPTPGRRPGRPRALDELKRRELIATIRAGCGLETAARYVGVSPRTVHRELRRNKQFWDQYRRAELRSRIGPLNTMGRAVRESWRAAAWMLERKSPRDFAKRHPSDD